MELSNESSAKYLVPMMIINSFIQSDDYLAKKLEKLEMDN